LALSVASRAHRDVVAASHPNDRPALQEIATLRASEKSLTEQKDAIENRAFAARSAAPPSALERAAARMAGKPAPMSEEDLWNAARSLGAQASQAHAQRIEREAQFVKAVDARGVAVPHIEDLLTVEHAIGRLEAGDMQGMPWPELFDPGALMPDRRCTQNLYEASRDASGLRFRTLAASGQLVAMREHLVSIAFMGVLKGAADATPLPRQTLTVHFSSSPIPDDPSIDDPNMAQIATRRHTDRETGQVTSQEYAVVGRDRQEHVFEFTEADGSQVFYVDTFNAKAHPPGTVMDQPE
jgi:hypothetical protein